MADSIKSFYISCARTLGLGDLTKVKTGDERTEIVTKCANGYIKATNESDERLRSAYISALMLLFWGEIKKMADKCRTVATLEYEDYVTKLFECINTACESQGWVKDPNLTAEQCIRSVIATRGIAAAFYESNLNKNKVNANTCSLDTPLTDDEGHEVTRLDLVSDETSLVSDLSAKQFVQSYINSNKIIEAIILDTIAFDNCNKYTKKTVVVKDENDKENKVNKVTTEFWAYKLVQLVSSLPDDYFNSFKTKYSINDLVLEAAINKIRASNNQKLYKYLAVTLADAKTKVADFM